MLAPAFASLNGPLTPTPSSQKGRGRIGQGRDRGKSSKRTKDFVEQPDFTNVLTF